MNDVLRAIADNVGVRVTCAPVVLSKGSERHAAAVAFVVAGDRALDGCLGQLLSPLETARLLPAPHYGRRRHQFVAGRFAAKLALAHLPPEAAPSALSILPGVLGHPVVSGPGIANLGVTLSNAGPAAYAIAFLEFCPLGVDIEEIVEDNARLLARQASDDELVSIRAAVGGDELVALTSLWSAKEALSKLLRCGLAALPATLGTASAECSGQRLYVEFTGFIGYRAFIVYGTRRCLAVALPPTVEWRTDCGDWLASPAPWLDAGLGDGETGPEGVRPPLAQINSPYD